MITLTVTATCHTCGWTEQGDPASTDKAAERHTKKTGHPTITKGTPA